MCKHDGGFDIVKTKDGQITDAICSDCGYPLLMAISELQDEKEQVEQDRDNLQEQLEAANTDKAILRQRLKEEILQSITDLGAEARNDLDLSVELKIAEKQRDELADVIERWKPIDSLKDEQTKALRADRDNLQAQVGVMRGALEGICRQADFTARAGGGKRRIATIPTGLNRQCNLEKAIEEADYVLFTTPEQDGERVRGLVSGMLSAQEAIALACDMLGEYREKYHDYEVPENTADNGPQDWIRNIETHLLGSNMSIADGLAKYRGGRE
ncbi:hypothetical protein M7775_13585 [Sporomusa sphaeroides DSM 2875]|uniref:hypothetical protein n=1 Tax=Sporomusa sphaeroides TaxID=47679 RepID=UPI00202F31B5|nr:hypothetical protein [Sporomusa sphaeroides]MCM0759585.1 hypothetical protein [Sporomusa sphaeroides DSM 2875]